jgi:hypothetical protein
METDIDGHGTRSRRIAQWQPAVLITACVAGGLVLSTMVIGSTPSVVVQASEAATEPLPTETATSELSASTEAPLDTLAPSDSAVAVESTTAGATSSIPGTAPRAPGAVAPSAGASTVSGTPTPSAAPISGTQPVPTASPTTPATAPAPRPVTTSAPTVAPTIPVVPQTAPTTAAPTTAAPAPTTAAPVAAALTYPSFTAGDAGTVVLQFDGSSIYVSSVARQPNWVSQIDSNGPRTVEIKFFNTVTHSEAEFHATVDGGRIQVEN